MQKRKLIEVALPLEAINRAAAHEKSVPRKGHPATTHLWWARRPLAAARAVLFAQLVDDPSSDPTRFPTEAAQRAERERLHDIIERLVKWESTRDEKLFAEAHDEIIASCNGSPPPILDPFAGGGTIPLEAQRLGLEAYASDLNPVAVLINKALIEIAPKFRDRPPVFPDLADGQIRTWKGAEGVAADVHVYGQWMRDEAEKRIGNLYPKASLPDGSKATVIAWIWARTVLCENPACGAEVPLLSSLALSKKKGREKWLKPIVEAGAVRFEIGTGPVIPAANKSGQGANFYCWVCRTPLSPNEIHYQLDKVRKPSPRMLCVVASSGRGRSYFLPDSGQTTAAESTSAQAWEVRRNDEALSPEARGTFGGNAQGRRYGFFSFADYFTDRQLVALTTFSDLVGEARERVLKDALAAGMPSGGGLESGGMGAEAYADAVATYLSFLISKLADWLSSLCSWIPQIEGVRDTFARQALPMVWDYVEINPFSSSVGNASSHFDWIVAGIAALPSKGPSATATQANASDFESRGVLISTDPPYYDNIVYSDLSDYFYVWHRRTLRSVYPELFGTMLVPKAEELVANRYRHESKEGARTFFEAGFRNVFSNIRALALGDYPITVYYAFKQSESDSKGVVSTGWETLLEGMVRSGWAITATWPVRSERSGRMLSVGTNALASSIVLALRPRPADAPTTDRRGFIASLRAELPEALRNLQQGQIAPVDLPQAAIGPGMAVFSRHSKVVEADGSTMTVRSALARINEILDEVLAEQEGDFDTVSRFGIAWYRQHGYGAGVFGAADDLARARNTTVELMDRHGILTSRAGKVVLIKSADLPADYDPIADPYISNWETLHHLIRTFESDGIPATGGVLASATSRPEAEVDSDLVKELAFLLFSIAEKNGWTKDALSFNALAQSWPDIVAASSKTDGASQSAFDFDQDAGS